MKIGFYSILLLNSMQFWQIYTAELKQPLISGLEPTQYPQIKVLEPMQYPQIKVNEITLSHPTSSCRAQNICKTSCSICTLAAATAAPLAASAVLGYTVGIVPSLHFCADQWASQLQEVKHYQCCCMTTSALVACAFFFPMGWVDTCCLWGPCNYSTNLGTGACYCGGKLFGDCLQKFRCTRQVGRSTGSLLGKIADKLNSCLPSCLQPQTISNCMEERFGIIWQDEESRIQAGLSILERSLTHKLAQIRTDASFADFVTRIEQLLHKIEAAKVGHAAENCEAILQEHVQLAEDINQATVKMYQQAQQAEQAEVQELRGTMAEHAIILRTLQQRLQREVATPASPMTAAEYVVVHGGGESPERDGDAGVAEDTHSKTA